MTEVVKPIECLHCGTRFSEAEISGAYACPGCGSESVPVDRRLDTQITINPHELRILTIWADNYASEHFRGKPGHHSLKRLLDRLRAQVKAPLTMGDEMKDLAAHFETKVTMTDGQGNVVREIDGTAGKA